MTSTKLNVQPMPHYEFEGWIDVNRIQLQGAEILNLTRFCSIRNPETFTGLKGTDSISVLMKKSVNGGEPHITRFASAAELLNELQRIYSERLRHNRTRAALKRAGVAPVAKPARFSFYGCDLLINDKVVSPHVDLPRFLSSKSAIRTLFLIRKKVNPVFMIQRRHDGVTHTAQFTTGAGVIEALEQIRAERAAPKPAAPVPATEPVVSTLYLSTKTATKKDALALRVGDIISCAYIDSEQPSIALVVCRSTQDDPMDFSVVMQESWGNKVRQRRLPQWGLNTDRWVRVGSTEFPTVIA